MEAEGASVSSAKLGYRAKEAFCREVRGREVLVEEV